MSECSAGLRPAIFVVDFSSDGSVIALRLNQQELEIAIGTDARAC
jgi:hypothetical protein